MIKLDEFISNNFYVTWTSIKIGLEGYKNFPPQLSINDIDSYATSLLYQKDNLSIEVLDLTLANSMSYEEIIKVINKLASKENIDINFEMRKWRVLYIKEVLNQIQSLDYLYGLIALADAWSLFDYPDDSPYIIQGVANNISPEDYYSNETFKYMIEKHKKWVTKEIQYLKVNNYYKCRRN